MESYYIISKCLEYKHDLLIFKKSDYKKIFTKNINSIDFFLIDYKNKKLYGNYKVNINDKREEDNCYILKITEKNYRRGIYYSSKKNDSIVKITSNEYKKLKRKLDILNNQMPQTFFSYSIKNNTFKYQIVETSKSLYVAEYEKKFDKSAFESIYREYKKLISIPSNENNNKYSVIGRALMNMLIPEQHIADFLLSSPRIVYLSDTKTKSKLSIPFEILNYNKTFLSKNIIFSYTHAKNITINSKVKKDRVKLAIISIPNEDLSNAEKEVDIILKNKSDYTEIDVFRKNMDYLEFINILEHYDLLHIITHGKKLGIMLSDKYLLKHISNLNNPPSLVFMNVCNSESDDNKLVDSIISSGVSTVISGVGSINDLSYDSFIANFYSNILNKESRLNTAEAYYFALIDNIDDINVFIRYRFNGIPCYL